MTGCTIDRMYGGQSLATVVVVVVVADAVVVAAVVQAAVIAVAIGEGAGCVIDGMYD